jgi:tetratricopeptide (TPR) repeat protein
VTRNPVWRDNETLFRQGVIDSPESYRAHFQLATHLFSIGQYAEGDREYRRAIELFPHDPVMAWAYAEQLRTAGSCERAIPIYKWIFAAQPNARRGHLGYAECLVQHGDFDAAREEALLWIRRGGRLSLARQILQEVKAARKAGRAG